MTTVRQATTRWKGSLQEGAGQVTLESSDLGTYDVTWASRAEEPNGKTSPEELIAAAHSACFSMALSSALAKAGTPPTSLDVRAEVSFKPGTGITGIHLTAQGDVDGIDEDTFVMAA
jgi:osmotically inducible protein OsmC